MSETGHKQCQWFLISKNLKWSEIGEIESQGTYQCEGLGCIILC